MARPLFSVPIADLESGDLERRWDVPTDWLDAALADSEATPRGTPGELDVTLTLNGQEVMVRGRVRAALTMPCARTLDPVDVDVDAEVFLMLSPSTVPAAPGARRARKGGGRRRRAPKAEDVELPPEEAARDSYDGEEVVLDAFAREFILLDLPMFPLRSDLRSSETPGIAGPPGASAEAEPPETALDPRLAPLAAIARRLRDKE